MVYEIVYSASAADDLDNIFTYLAEKTDTENAQRHVDAVLDYCEESIASLPHQGNGRDDIRPGLRMTHYKKKTSIAIVINDAEQKVYILEFFMVDRIMFRS